MRSSGSVITLEHKDLLEKLELAYPDTRFLKSDHFRWSPEDKSIYYNPASPSAIWSLLHEVGHMLQGHTDYRTDIGLLKMEVSAWGKARELSQDFDIDIEEEHIEKCLDSYREWIYRRSSCPLCTQAGLERSSGIYTCINCQKKWRVTPARFCRVYRKAVTDRTS